MCLFLVAGYVPIMELILWIVAMVIFFHGIFALLSGRVLYGVGVIVLACLVGPGGVSLLT